MSELKPIALWLATLSALSIAATIMPVGLPVQVAIGGAVMLAIGLVIIIEAIMQRYEDSL